MVLSESSRCHEKSIETKQEGKKLAILAKGLVLFIHKAYLQMKKKANVPNEKEARKINKQLG